MASNKRDLKLRSNLLQEFLHFLVLAPICHNLVILSQLCHELLYNKVTTKEYFEILVPSLDFNGCPQSLTST